MDNDMLPFKITPINKLNNILKIQMKI